MAQWHAVWDTAGWNQVRVKFFGGLTAGSPTRMQAWIRRLNNPPVAPPDNWVPTHDSAMNIVTPANPIGLQIHGGNDYWNRAGRGTWYRNIKIRALDASGNPVPVSLLRHRGGLRADLSGQGGVLQGRMTQAHEIVVRDARGQVVRRFRGHAGDVSYPLGARGVFTVEVREAGAVRFLKVAAL